MVAMAVPINVGDHGARTAGHEPRSTTRARVTPAGALAWVRYVRVVIPSRTFPMDRDLIKARIWDHAGATASNDLSARGRTHIGAHLSVPPTSRLR